MASPKVQKFIDYVALFYCGTGIYANFFQGKLTPNEVTKAVKIYLESCHDFEGDSVDREFVRDILFSMRGEPTEHDVSKYFQKA